MPTITSTRAGKKFETELTDSDIAFMNARAWSMLSDLREAGHDNRMGIFILFMTVAIIAEANKFSSSDIRNLIVALRDHADLEGVE